MTPAGRKRLSALTFRRRNRAEVAGPALRVIDVDAVTARADMPEKKVDEVSVQVSLTIEALDIEGECPLFVFVHKSIECLPPFA
jgi:hypothetical protein